MWHYTVLPCSKLTNGMIKLYTPENMANLTRFIEISFEIICNATAYGWCQKCDTCTSITPTWQHFALDSKLSDFYRSFAICDRKSNPIFIHWHCMIIERRRSSSIICVVGIILVDMRMKYTHKAANPRHSDERNKTFPFLLI